jgi:hypothetical protein
MTDPERLARIRRWLDLLREEFLALVTDDDTYWRLQKEVIQRNHRLLTMRSPFFDLVNSAYVSTTASAIRRLIETQNRGKTNVSLRILLDEIGKYPKVLERPIPVEQIRNDLARLDEVECKLKPYVDRVVAHLDRRGLAKVPKLDDLKESVAALGEVFRRYYGAVEDSDLTLTMSYLDDFDIFAFPWVAEPRKSLLGG